MEPQSTQTPCDVCGKPADVVINTVAWCAECFHEMGSCCGTFGSPEPTPDPPAP